MWLTPEQRLARVEAMTDAMVHDLRKLIQERNASPIAAAVDQQKQIIVESYRESSAYANLIILAGYAGIFALWQMTNSSLAEVLKLATGSALIASILLFAGYETYKMIRNAIHLQRLERALNRLPLEQRLEAWQAGVRQGYEAEHRIWLYFLIPTVVTGFGAGFVLLFALLIRMFSSLS